MSKEYRIQPLDLDQLDYDSISKVLQEALGKNFQNSSVEVVESHPNFKEDPWSLSSEGICGNCVLADIGGPNNLHYHENHRIIYNMEEIAKAVNKQGSFVMGPGAASYTVTGCNAELIANANLGNNVNLSKAAYVVDEHFKQIDYKSNDIGVLANLMFTEGKPGRVIKVSCSVRTGKFNIVSCMKQALDAAFPQKTIGLGGVFLLKTGKIRAHVMPDFPKLDILSKQESDEWLKFYEMGAQPGSPLVCTSVFVSNDRSGLDLRQEHSHFYSKHGDAGHYHYDITPDIVEYEGYFVLCQKLYRIDIPTHSPDRTTFFKG